LISARESERVEAFLEELSCGEQIRILYRRYGLWFGWAAMFTIVLANVAALITGTIINVAIPDIMGTFGIGQDKAQWLATAFLASSTVTMLMNSWLIQTIGVRATVIAAMSIFMAGSVLGGISPNTDLLIVARILQGAATGVITPMSMSMVFQLFPAGRQGTVLGVTSIGIVLAPALGPALGGYLIDTFNWRYVYLMGIPVSLLVVPAAAALLPAREKDAGSQPLDWLGLVLVSVAISALLIALSNGQREGWSSDFVLSWAALSAVSTGCFLLWEKHCPHPLLDLRVFTYYRFTMITVLAFIFGAGLYGTTYLVPLFLQIAQHRTAMDSGLMMVPAGIVMAACFPFSGRLADRMDQRVLIGSGFLILALSSLLMVRDDPNTSWQTFALWVIISRVGIGIMAPVLNLAAIQGLPMQYLQQGAGTMNFIRQLGGAFGVNLLSVALAYRTSFHQDALLATQSFDHSDTFELVAELQRSLAGAGLSFWEEQQVVYGILGRIVHQQAYVLGFQDGFLFLTVVFLVTLVPIGLLRRRHMRASV
jgi:EmrB/QacA subfamily drug resistance transporter